MQFRRVGHSGLKISALGLGGWLSFGTRLRTAAEVTELIALARDYGVNHFDLANVYAKGEAERLAGEGLKQFPRSTFVLSTKAFYPMSADINDRGLSRKHIHESLSASLQRLKTDYVDIFYCHRFDPETPVAETIGCLEDLRRCGRLHYWGVSEWSSEQILEAYRVCSENKWQAPIVDQSQWNLIHTDRVRNQMLPLAKKEGLGIIGWGPLAGGLLTGKYQNSLPEHTRLREQTRLREDVWIPEKLEKVRKVIAAACTLGITPSQLAISWAASQPHICGVLLGATSRAQLVENLGSIEHIGRIPEELLA